MSHPELIQPASGLADFRLRPAFSTLPSGSPHHGLGDLSPQVYTILNHLKGQMTAATTTGSYVKQILALSFDDRRTLADQAVHLKPLSQIQKRVFVNTAVQELASTEGRDTVTEAARIADLKDVDAEIKASGHVVKPFAPMIDPLEKRYLDLLGDCKTFASLVGRRAKDFTGEVVDELKRTDLQLADKVKVIKNYIRKTEDLESDSKTINSNLTFFRVDFSKLMDKFRNLSTEHQPNLAAKIVELQKKLNILKGELAALQSQLTTLNIAAGAVGSLATGLAAIFPPAAIYIIAGGVVGVVGLQVYAGVISSKITIIEDEQKDTQKQLARLKDEQAANLVYNRAAEKLETLSRDNDGLFAHSITFVESIFRNILTDARGIQDSLESAADVVSDDTTDDKIGAAARKQRLEEDLDGAKTLYFTVAEYLDVFEALL